MRASQIQRTSRHKVGWVLLCLAILVHPAAITTAASGQARPIVRIGLVSDGPGASNAEIAAQVVQEIVALNEREFDVRFPVDRFLLGEWTAETVSVALERLLGDPEVDIVLAMGVIASTLIVQRDALPKPVIAPFVIDPQLQGLPSEGRVTAASRAVHVSGIANLSYLLSPWDTLRDLQEFRAQVEFNKVAFLVDGRIFEALEPARSMLTSVANQSQPPVAFQVVGLYDDAEAALRQLDPDVDAVMTGILVNLPESTAEGLFEGLIERRLPSFAIFGRDHVDRGALLGLAPDSDLLRLSRRIAIYVQRILQGEDAGELPVEFAQQPRLTLNRGTARAIGYSPSFELLTRAEVLHEAPREVAATWTLESAIEEALLVNLDLLASTRGLAISDEDVRGARSNLRPQLTADLGGVWIDSDRAEASFGSRAERTTTASLGLTQLLWSDAARSGVEIAEIARGASRDTHRQLRLDVIRETAVTYLGVLRAKTLEQIRKQNLDVTRVNLELARGRLRAGTANPAEVARWDSQIATDQRNVIDATALRNQAEIALNRLLNRPMEEPHDLVDPLTNGAARVDFAEQVRPFIDDIDSFERFRDFMATEALRESPELAIIDAAIAAQRRALVAAKRSFWRPTVALQGALSQVLGRGGAGSAAGASIPGFSLSPAGDTDWSVAIGASLPVLTGGFRSSERGRAQVEIERLTLQRRATEQRIEQGVRATIHAAGASRAAIALTREAATAAQRNLELVQDAYGQGLAAIIDLVDAQTARLVADLAAATASYDHLENMIEVERAAGAFWTLASPAEQLAWMQRLRDHYASVREDSR